MSGYWNNLRPFEKRVFVGVTAMLFIVFNLWFVFPHFSDWGKVQARMSTAQQKLDTFNKEIRQTASYSNRVWELEGQGLAVPPEDQSIHFLRAVQAQALQSKIGGVNYGAQQLRTNQFFLELSQNIGMTCGETELVDFLYNLGAGTSLIRVRDLTLKPDVPRQQLSAQIKLVASYQKKAGARGAQPTTGKAAAPPGPVKASPNKTKSPPPDTRPPPKQSPQTNKPSVSTTKKA